MKRISPERKAATLVKLLSPYNMTVATDRGWQYCSADYQALLKRYNLHGSISAQNSLKTRTSLRTISTLHG